MYSQGGSAQVGTEIEVGDALGNCEGLHIRVFGDGQQYMVDVSHGAECPLSLPFFPCMQYGPDF